MDENMIETEERLAVQAGRTYSLLHDSDYSYGVPEGSAAALAMEAEEVFLETALTNGYL